MFLGRRISLLTSSRFFGLLTISVLSVSLLSPLSLTRRHQTFMAATTVPLYSKFELSYPYTGSYNNPNDPSIVDVEATFTSPTGKRITIPGFFFQDFTRSGDRHGETLTVVQGSDAWKVRFAPTEVGTYSYQVTLKDSQGTKTLGTGTFTAVASANSGFIHAFGYHLQFDNGKQFIPLGLNAPWFQDGGNGQAWGDGTYGVDEMYRQFQQNGANFFHFWTCEWNQGEAKPWAKPNIGCNGSATTISQMSQPDSWEIDYMVDQGLAKGITLMPVLKLSSLQDDQTFTAADKIKARYFVARWGYATNIVAWDFIKEGDTTPSTNASWAQYMQSIDPYHHLLTTSEWDHYPANSAGNANIYKQIFGSQGMTLVQDHDYTGDCTDVVNADPGFPLFLMKLDAAGTDPRDFHAFGKPSFFGEVGVNPGDCSGDGGYPSPLYPSDHNGLLVKSELWGTLMGSAMAAAPWYFQFDPNGAWTQLVAFKGIDAYANALPPIPDSANLFTTYQDTAQATASDSRLRVIGRKNATFAMLFAQNTTALPIQILKGTASPVPLSGTIRLKGMQQNASFTIRWFNTDTGAVIKTDTVHADASGLTLTLPQQVNQNIAAIVTTGETMLPKFRPN